ncbi:GntR family transcriptional regulator [Companilactobacillus halodurans]|uniref:GntR family transcriptional regulator n=1 Tax=Companilactobacillus halodurans TaxID=2584183 RepID=A0A5P0ZZC6_9LACO|nr:GntR family transcriptional regulator [Companilactobacillus halodurans]MQS98172.1 GntR family transcriptional regulator [Companilactobacillus halodurans]
MKVTLQEQLVNQLTSYVQDLPANKKLLSERQLADKYQVSRNTIRFALLELEATGIVRRIQGKGTFVNRINLDSDLGYSFKFNQQMRLLGKQPSTKIINFKKREANAYFAKNLAMAVGEGMFLVERLRLADNLPMMLERSFLPEKIFKTLSLEELRDQSMYEVFQRDFNEEISYADEYFSASVISNCNSEIMQLKSGTPCLQLERKSYDLQNRIIEFTLSVARSDEFSYHVRHDIEA